MHFSKSIVALASLAAYASAQDTPEGTVKVHVIQALIKDNAPVFDPPEVQAAVGDLIQFQFHPMNHSVVRAAFTDPCIPIEDSPNANGTTGFYSGFMPVTAESEIMPSFTIPVEDEKPIWFYCSAGRHCQAGMVGVINPTTERTLEAFRALAADAPENRSPGQEDVGEGGVEAPTNGTYPDGPTPTTIETSTISGTRAPTSTTLVPGAASKLGSSVPLVLAAVAASFFLL